MIILMLMMVFMLNSDTNDDDDDDDDDDYDDYFFHFVVPMEIFPMWNSGRFPRGKPASTQSRYPNLNNC